LGRGCEMAAGGAVSAQMERAACPRI